MKKIISLLLFGVLLVCAALPAGAVTLSPGQRQTLADVSANKENISHLYNFNGKPITVENGMARCRADSGAYLWITKAMAGVSLVGWEYFAVRVQNHASRDMYLNVAFWSNSAFCSDFLLLNREYEYLDSSSGYTLTLPAGFDGWIYASTTSFIYQGGNGFIRTKDDTTVFTNPNEGDFYGAECDPLNIASVMLFFPDQMGLDLSVGDMLLLNIDDGTATATPGPTAEPTPEATPTPEPTSAPTPEPTPTATPFFADLRNVEYILIGIIAAAVIVTVLVLVKKEKK